MGYAFNNENIPHITLTGNLVSIGYLRDQKTSVTFPDRVSGEGFSSSRLCYV